MTLKLANKVFLEKSTQFIHFKYHKEPYNTALWTRKQGMEQLTDTQRHRNPVARAPRVDYQTLPHIFYAQTMLTYPYI